METRSKLNQSFLNWRFIRFKQFLNSNRSRSGYSLAEMALAMMATSMYLGSLMWAIAGGVNLTLKADQRTIALALAQAKMSQLVNNPNLSPTDTDYAKISGSGIYNNYRWKIKISQDKVNLAEVAQSGKINFDVSDKVPAGVQNQSTKKESMGSSTSTETGGELEIYRIIIMIRPPKTSSVDFVYRVSTFQPVRKTSSAEGF